MNLIQHSNERRIPRNSLMQFMIGLHSNKMITSLKLNSMGIRETSDANRSIFDSAITSIAKGNMNA
jgi:hypothetical protein